MNEQRGQKRMAGKFKDSRVSVRTVKDAEQRKYHGENVKRVANTQSGIIAQDDFIDRIVAFDFAGKPNKRRQNDQHKKNSCRQRQRTQNDTQPFHAYDSS